MWEEKLVVDVGYFQYVKPSESLRCSAYLVNARPPKFFSLSFFPGLLIENISIDATKYRPTGAGVNEGDSIEHIQWTIEQFINMLIYLSWSKTSTAEIWFIQTNFNFVKINIALLDLKYDVYHLAVLYGDSPMIHCICGSHWPLRSSIR